MDRRRSHRRRWLRRLRDLRVAVVARLVALWRGFRARGPAVRVEILAAERAQRWRLEREVRSALRRLQRVADPPLHCDAAVLVQRSVRNDRPLAGCALVTSQPDGARFAVIRVGTHAGGRALAVDEVLATLAELWIGVAAQQLGGATVLIPAELEPEPAAGRPSRGLAPDPLPARANGRDRSQADRYGPS